MIVFYSRPFAVDFLSWLHWLRAAPRPSLEHLAVANEISGPNRIRIRRDQLGAFQHKLSAEPPAGRIVNLIPRKITVKTVFTSVVGPELVAGAIRRKLKFFVQDNEFGLFPALSWGTHIPPDREGRRIDAPADVKTPNWFSGNLLSDSRRLHQRCKLRWSRAPRQEEQDQKGVRANDRPRESGYLAKQPRPVRHQGINEVHRPSQKKSIVPDVGPVFS